MVVSWIEGRVDKSDTPKTSVYVLRDIVNLPKNPAQWPGNKPYVFEQHGKKYIFWKEGRAGIYNSKTGKYETDRTSVVIEKIKDIDASIKRSKREVSGLKNTILPAKPEQKPVVQEQPGDTKQEINDDILLAGLVSLFGGSQKKINGHLERNKDQYGHIVNLPEFDQKLKKAIEDPKKNAFIIQLYGKFVLHNDSIIVDGKYGPQTKQLVELYLKEGTKENLADREDRIQEKRNERISMIKEKYLSSPKEQQLSMIIGDQFNKALPEEARNTYFEQIGLDDSIINNLLTEEEKNRDPKEIESIRNAKRKQMYNRTIRSAQNACVNYLQAVFNTTIEVKDVKPITLSVSDNLDPNRDTSIHDGESIDFNIISNGIPLKVCYNLKEGKISYNASFSVDSGGINTSKEWREKTVLTWAPSLHKLIEKGKKSILEASFSSVDPWSKVKSEIESLSKPEVDYKDRSLVEKMVAREDCVKSIKELTGYTLPFDLPKDIYQNTQLYMLYDIFEHTFSSPKITAQDIYNFKYNILEKLKSIVADYTNQQRPKFVKNIRTNYFNQEKFQKDKKDLLSAKINSSWNEALSFFSFFTQFLKNSWAQENTDDYRVLDFVKLEWAINYYNQKKYLPDTTLVASIEKKEREDNEISFETALKTVV